MTTAWHETLHCDCLKLTCSRMPCLVRVWANLCHPDTKDSWEPNFAVHALGPRNPKSRALLLHHAVIARSSCLPMFSCTAEPQSVEQTNCTLLHSMICIVLMTSVASWQPSGWIYCSLGTVICPHPSRFPTASSFFSCASQCAFADIFLFQVCRHSRHLICLQLLEEYASNHTENLQCVQMPRGADKFHPRCPCPLLG